MMTMLACMHAYQLLSFEAFEQFFVPICVDELWWCQTVFTIPFQVHPMFFDLIVTLNHKANQIEKRLMFGAKMIRPDSCFLLSISG